MTLEKLILRLRRNTAPLPQEGNELERFVARLRNSDEVSLAKMFPAERIEQIKKKELRRYKARQNERWENWLKAVSR